MAILLPYFTGAEGLRFEAQLGPDMKELKAWQWLQCNRRLVVVSYPVPAHVMPLLPPPDMICSVHWSPPRPQLTAALEGMPPPGVHVFLDHADFDPTAKAALQAQLSKAPDLRFWTAATKAQAVEIFQHNPPSILAPKGHETFATLTSQYPSTVNMLATYNSPLGQWSESKQGEGKALLESRKAAVSQRKALVSPLLNRTFISSFPQSRSLPGLEIIVGRL